jgi:hypothetical protein
MILRPSRITVFVVREEVRYISIKLTDSKLGFLGLGFLGVGFGVEDRRGEVEN